MNKVVRVLLITVVCLEGIVTPIALLGLIPTDSASAYSVEKYWILGACLGWAAFALGRWWLKKHKVSL